MKSAALSYRLLILTLFLFVSSAFAADWEEVTDAEWQMGPPQEYPQAGAVVIFDIGLATAELKGLEFERHVRFKIFNEAGLRKVETVEVEYFEYDDFFDQKARIYRPDGSHVEFDKNYFEIKEAGVKRKAVFTFPNVKPGDILEYQYKIRYYGGYDKLGPEKYFLFSQEKRYSQYKARERLGGGDWDDTIDKNVTNLPTWFFDHPVFCLSSTFTAKLGSELDYGYCAINVPADNVDPVTESIKFLTATVYRSHTWTLENVLPFIPDTSYFYDDEVLRSGLHFQLFSTEGHNRILRVVYSDEHMQYLGQSFQGYLGEFVKTTKKMKKQVFNLTKNAPDARAKAEAIYNYIADRYTIEASGYVLRPTQNDLKGVFKETVAAPFEMNILLVKMFQMAGLEAWPVLISTRDKLPFRLSSKFNHMLALVDIDGEQILADASAKGCPFGSLPHISMVKEGVIVDYSDSRPIAINAPECTATK